MGMRLNGLKHLSPNERRALDSLVRQLRDKYAKQIEQVILFGSRARGDATFESDFDLLIVTKNGGKKFEQRLTHFVNALGFEHNLVFAPHQIRSKELARKRTREPFYRSIVSEGIDLFGKTPRRISRSKPLVYSPPAKGFEMDKNARIQIQIRLE